VTNADEIAAILLGAGAAVDAPSTPMTATAARRWISSFPPTIRARRVLAQDWRDGRAPGNPAAPPEYFPLSSDRRVAAEQGLVFASMCGQTEIVRLLLGSGVDVNTNPPGSHWTATPLHAPAIQGRTEIVA
jgi:hypothetical protein